MGLLTNVVDKVYPRAKWPTASQIRGYGAWGGVLVAGAMYVVQPWDWLASFGKKESQ